MGDLIVGWPLSPKDSAVRFKQDFNLLKNKYLIRPRAKLRGALQYSKDGHALTIAPTGAGKGRSVIIPNLLNYAGSVIAFDPKGENYAVTARFRRQTLGQDVYVLDPFSLTNAAKRDRLNPIDLLTLSSVFDRDESLGSKDAQMLSSLIYGESLHSHDPYWDDSARSLLAALIFHVAKSSEISRGDKHLGTLTTLAHDSNLQYLLETMASEGRLHPFAYRAASSFLAAPEQPTGNSIRSTLLAKLTFLEANSVLEALSGSTVDIRQVWGEISQSRNFTIYIVIPTENLISHRALLRLWVGILLTAIMRRHPRPAKRTLLLLDECAQLGELDELRLAVTLLRGFGLLVWMFFQDMSQLTRLYSDWASLTNNCNLHQAFGATTPDAAFEVSRLFGSEQSDNGRLLSSKDFLYLDKTEQFISGADDQMTGALRVRKLDYLTDRAFVGRFDPNPVIPRHLDLTFGLGDGVRI